MKYVSCIKMQTEKIKVNHQTSQNGDFYPPPLYILGQGRMKVILNLAWNFVNIFSVWKAENLKYYILNTLKQSEHWALPKVFISLNKWSRAGKFCEIDLDIQNTRFPTSVLYEHGLYEWNQVFTKQCLYLSD